MDQISNLDNLRITSQDIDELTGLDVNELMVGWAYRLSLFRSPQRVLSWAMTQMLTVGVTLVLCIPMTLLIGRSLGGSAQTATVLKYVPMGVGVAISMAATWNVVLLYRGQQRTTLTYLLDEIDRFNEILKAVEILNELKAVGSQSLQLENVDAVLAALHLTRESLINGLMTERVMRKHQRFIARRYDLFNRIEQNLISLQAMQLTTAAGEYGQLLNEALQVGTSVCQELQKFHDLQK